MFNRRHQLIMVMGIWLISMSTLFAQTTYFEKPDNVTWSDSSVCILSKQLRTNSMIF